AEKPQWLTERQQILRGVVDTLALALANLRLRETLRQQSIRDPNTGLFNRRYLEETSSRELRRMERSSQPLAVIMLDVDHFKQFNDTFGHEAGDLVLKQVAATLIEHARDTDVVSRYGGEEFALVMPGCSLKEGAKRAETLRQAIKQLHLAHRGRTLGTVTASSASPPIPSMARAGPSSPMPPTMRNMMPRPRGEIGSWSPGPPRRASAPQSSLFHRRNRKQRDAMPAAVTTGESRLNGLPARHLLPFARPRRGREGDRRLTLTRGGH
ncbi:MAG: GGDEF domain-containing protein, partial [Mesorhizobium sp.]